jgi:uncharacterized protein YbjQ (UPF0145 family)
MVGGAPTVHAAWFRSIRSGEHGSRTGRRAADSIGNVLVVTTDQLPGYEIRQILGEVVSSMARTRNPYREGVKNLRGGAYDPMAPDNLTRWRTDSVARLGEEARRLGANAVIGMRFDSRDCGEMWMEICAYGTCVVAEPMPVVARRQRTMWSLRTRAADGAWRSAIPQDARREGDEYVFELPAGGPEPLLKALIDGDAGIETLAIERPGLHDAFVAIAGNKAAAEMGQEKVQ